MDRIRINAHELMNQSSCTVQNHLIRIRRVVDNEFGAGYAENNPTLVGSLVVACAIDFATGMGSAVYQDTQDQLNMLIAALEKVADSINSSDGLYQIAQSIEQERE